MATVVCMNASCGATVATVWKKGWRLRSGGFASLCDKCGSAYEQLIFCEMYHNNESGWRECSSCCKRFHCGCIASRSLFGLVDRGGIECIDCTKKSERASTPGDGCADATIECPKILHSLPKSPIDEKTSMHVTSGTICEEESSSPDTEMEDNGVIEGNNGLDSVKREQVMLSFPNIIRQSITTSQGAKEAPSTANTCFTLGILNSKVPHLVPGVSGDRLEENKYVPSFQQGQKSRHLLPKPPKVGPILSLETSKDPVSQIRVARPPVEGRGRNQLLPRYWPRITDQELQQISGDSNSTIVPLFEKVLSASDAGRIGRLVLPKACAEAYFPPISQPEGLPLKIQDAKGKDWMFQFRFWPNNNSRMYVLEGVTPCIQSMQLQAGDTVTFSRIEPGGKLVMGFRKASNSMTVQDSQVSASSISNGALAKDSFYSGVIDNLPVISGYSGLLKSLKGSADPHLAALSEQMIDGDVSWLKPDNHGVRLTEGFQCESSSFPERKRSRNISTKNKRLHIDLEDALELKLTWEEAQDLLRPPPSVKPSIVLVDDHELEEYEEPPVLGKRTIFTAKPFGEHDQWAQCDSCYKWRRLPAEVMLPARWTCAENTWDPKRCSCSVPDEISPKELANLLKMNLEFKKRKISGTPKETPTGEQSGLDALASAAVLGDNGNSNPPSTAPTTKHPRHRAGCMCIVCIQPPSGKGPKHKPTCTCNVCLTVKRRFKTLMMRKKKRQMEREAEAANKKIEWAKDEAEVDSSFRREDLEQNQCSTVLEKTEISDKVGIDLNCDPNREEDLCAGACNMSMMSLLQVATFPLETYLKQNGLTSLACEQQASSSSLALPQTTVDSEGQGTEENYLLASRAKEEGIKDGATEQT